MWARTLCWVGAALAPLVLAGLAILHWDRNQRMAEARAEADRSAHALASRLDATVGTAMRQIEALSDSDVFRDAYTDGDLQALGRQLRFLSHHPSWLGATVVQANGQPLLQRGTVPEAYLSHPPQPGGVTIIPRAGAAPPMVVAVAQISRTSGEIGELIGVYSLEELEDTVGTATDRTGLTLVATPDGTVLLGPLDTLGSTISLSASGGNLKVYLADQEALAAVAPAAGGALRAVALRISTSPGRSAIPALGGLALAAILLVVFIVLWQFRLLQMVRRLRVREQEVAALNELATDATMSPSAFQVIQMAGARAAQLFGADRSFVAQVVGEGTEVHVTITYPRPRETPLTLDPSGNPYLARTLLHGRREMGTANQVDPRWRSAGLEVQGWQCWTPLVAHGRILGALGLANDGERADLEADERRLLDGITATLAVALESHQRLAQVAGQRAMLATVLDASPDGMMALDESTQIILDNPAARSLLGVERPLRGSSLADVLAAVERNGSQFEWDFDFMELIARSREGQTTRGSFRLRDGQLRRMESMMAPLPLPQGATGTLVSLRDVSERTELAMVRRLNERVSILARQTSARAALLEQVLAAADVGMAFIGADQKVSWKNRRFGELLGISHSLRGLSAAALEKEIASVVEVGFRQIAPGADLLTTRGPERRMLAMRTVEVRDQEGNEVGLLVSLRDETAQRELAQAREQFIGIAAHELKNPLTVLRIQAELGIRDPKRQFEALQRILSKASQLQELIDRLLDATRAELGKLDLSLEDVDLRELAMEAAEPFLAQGAPLTIRAEAGLSTRGDPIRLQQLLGNLISNAVRYGGDERLDVTVSTTASEARIAVQDRGPGIPLDEQATIFERYGQGRAAKKGQGLGLGLFLAQRIAQAHGGIIQLNSAPGAGSTFTVVLPIGGPER